MQTSFYVGEKVKAVLRMTKREITFDGVITEINFNTDKAKVSGWWIDMKDVSKNKVLKNEN